MTDQRSILVKWVENEIVNHFNVNNADHDLKILNFYSYTKDLYGLGGTSDEPIFSMCDKTNKRKVYHKSRLMIEWHNSNGV